MAKIKTKRVQVKFAPDNVTGACPEVLDAILKANEVFAKFPRHMIEHLNSEGYKMNEDELDGKAVRLVAAWNTKTSDVENFLNSINQSK